MTAICSAEPDLVRASHSIALDPAAEWIQLLPFGNLIGRDGRGPYVMPEANAQSVLDATRALAGSMDLVVDYDHQTDLAAVKDVGGTAPAAGWIKELQARQDGIYGRVEWTARGARALKSKEYRYISPVFDHTRTGLVVTRLLRAALTNNPNLEMTALAAAQPHEAPAMILLQKIAAALGLPADATEASVLERATAAALASTALGRVATALGKKPEDQADELVTAAQSAVTGFDKAAKAVGKTGTDSADDVVTAINAAKAAGAPDPALYVPIAQVTALQSQVKGLVERDVNDDVDRAIQSGKVAPALRQWATDLRTSNPAAFKTFVDGAPALVQEGSTLTIVPAGGSQEGTLTDSERAIASALGQTPEFFLNTKKGMG